MKLPLSTGFHGGFGASCKLAYCADFFIGTTPVIVLCVNFML